MDRADLIALGDEMDAVWGQMSVQEQAAWNRGVTLLEQHRAAEQAAQPVPQDPLAPEPGGKSGEERAAEVNAHYHGGRFIDDPLGDVTQ